MRSMSSAERLSSSRDLYLKCAYALEAMMTQCSVSRRLRKLPAPRLVAYSLPHRWSSHNIGRAQLTDELG